MTRPVWLPCALVWLCILCGARAASANPVVLNENSGTCNPFSGCTIALPFSPTTGQVDLYDFVPGFGFFVLDVITFSNPTNTAIFASDNIDGFDDPADTYGPPPPLPNVVFLPEPQVTSGPETLTYTPLPGQPGYVAGANITYRITSDSNSNDSTPEPLSLVLLGTGLFAVVAVIRRQWVHTGRRS